MNIKPETCESCGEKFDNKRELKGHISSVHARRMKRHIVSAHGKNLSNIKKKLLRVICILHIKEIYHSTKIMLGFSILYYF